MHKGFLKLNYRFGSQVPAPPSRNSGERRIMSPTTDADNTVATRHNNPTAVEAGGLVGAPKSPRNSDHCDASDGTMDKF